MSTWFRMSPDDSDRPHSMAAQFRDVVSIMEAIEEKNKKKDEEKKKNEKKTATYTPLQVCVFLVAIGPFVGMISSVMIVSMFVKWKETMIALLQQLQ